MFLKATFSIWRRPSGLRYAFFLHASKLKGLSEGDLAVLWFMICNILLWVIESLQLLFFFDVAVKQKTFLNAIFWFAICFGNWVFSACIWTEGFIWRRSCDSLIYDLRSALVAESFLHAELKGLSEGNLACSEGDLAVLWFTIYDLLWVFFACIGTEGFQISGAHIPYLFFSNTYLLLICS